MSEWISIKSAKIPDQGQECLVAYQLFNLKLYVVAVYHFGEFLSSHERSTVFDATHWMPLPELPQ